MKYNEKRDPIRLFIELFGGKWRLLILDELFSQTQRFKDLQKNVEGITPRMLTKELKVLVANNIVEKEVYKEMPPRVEYSLTDFGIKLLPLIENIKHFGNDLIDQSVYAQKPFEIVDTPIAKSEPVAIEKVETIDDTKEKTDEPNFIKIEIVETAHKVKKVETKKSVWRNYQKVDFDAIDLDQNFLDDSTLEEEQDAFIAEDQTELIIEQNVETEVEKKRSLLDQLIVEKASKKPSKKETVANTNNTGVQLSLF